MRRLLLLLSILPTFALASDPAILYIGDSISYGQFGAETDKTLRSFAIPVKSAASCGSTPRSWLTNPGAITNCGFWSKTDSNEFRARTHATPTLQIELAKLHPVLTIIQLGTNIAAGSNPESKRGDIITMLEQIRAAGSACLWIGPPDANSNLVTREKLRVTNEMIQAEVVRHECLPYINTLSFTNFPAGPGDGIHPSPTLARQWAMQVAARMRPIIERFLRQ